MPLIDSNANIKPSTLEEKQGATKVQLARLTTQAFIQLKLAHQQGDRLVHRNPFGLTKEEVLAGLGEDAADLTRLSGLLTQTLNTAVPGTIPNDDADVNPSKE